METTYQNPINKDRLVSEADILTDKYGNVYVNPEKIETKTFQTTPKRCTEGEINLEHSIFCGNA